MTIRILSGTIAILLTANIAATAAQPSGNVRYYGGRARTSSAASSMTTAANSSSINANQHYKVFYQYYVHYFNWYAKRTRNQDQCRKLATLAAVRQLSIEKARTNSRTTAPVEVATSLKLPGVALANNLDREDSNPSVPGSVESASAGTSTQSAPESSSTSNVPVSAGFQPAPEEAKRQTNSNSRSAEGNQSSPALRGPLPIARTRESKFQSRIQEELENPTGLRGPLPTTKTGFEALRTAEKPGAYRSPDLVDLAAALQPLPSEQSQSAPAGTSLGPGKAPTSPMMQIAAAVSQETKPNKKWWQVQLRKNNRTAPEESKRVNFPLIAQTPATTPPPATPATREEPTPNQAIAVPSELRSTPAPLTGGVTKKTELSQVITSAPFERAWAKERYAEAKVFAAELAKTMPDSRYYAARYYVCCIQTADWTNAYGALERLVSLDQSHKDIYACDYGRILFELHKYEPAKAKLKEALAFGNDSEPVHRTLLLIAIAQKDDAAAIGEYKQIARLCPRDFDSRIELAELLWKGNRKDEAVKIYDQVAAMIPDNADIQSKAGYANLVQGNYKAAMNAYKLASDSSSQQKYKNAKEFAEAQFVTVQKVASTAKAISQD